MFTDMNVRFPYNSIKNCCKTMDYQLTLDELASLSAADKSVLIANNEYMKRKKSMVIDNRLPLNGCMACVNAEPYSLFRSWNIWDDKNRPSDESLLNDEHFTTYEFVLNTSCDLKCVYCGAKDSSSWAKELGEPIRKGDPIWKENVLSNLFEHLKSKIYKSDEKYWFFFSGGEPTYNTETLKVIEKVIEIVPNPNIIITTNGNTKEKIMNRYMALMHNYSHVNWTFDVSMCDTYERAEAIRYGLNWNRAIANISRMLDEDCNVRIAPTVNMLSVSNMYSFVEFFYDLFDGKKKANEYMFTFNMVQDVELSPMSMPTKYKHFLDDAIEYCHSKNLSFGNYLTSVQNLIGTKIYKNTHQLIDIKWKYFKEKRKDTNWDELFPIVNQIVEELKNENIDIRK